MIVLKFGGTSVRDAEWITRTIEIAENQLDRAPVLVASAMGKTTDALVAAAESAEAGDQAAVVAAVDALESSHQEALETLLSSGSGGGHDSDEDQDRSEHGLIEGDQQ